MRVIARQNSWRKGPALVGVVGPQEDGVYDEVKIGAEYEVHAITVFQGIVDFQIIVWHGPFLYPAVFFDVIDSSFPDDWVCRSFNDSHLQMVIGPEFMAKDIESYSATVEKNPPQSDLFWERIKRIEAQRPKGNAAVLLDNWVQCPLCDEAWEVKIEESVSKCPKCSTVLNNPLYSAK